MTGLLPVLPRCCELLLEGSGDSVLVRGHALQAIEIPSNLSKQKGNFWSAEETFENWCEKGPVLGILRCNGKQSLPEAEGWMNDGALGYGRAAPSLTVHSDSFMRETSISKKGNQGAIRVPKKGSSKTLKGDDARGPSQRGKSLCPKSIITVKSLLVVFSTPPTPH